MGPEIGRFNTAARVDPEWLQCWARALPPGGPAVGSVLRSAFAVVDLPTPSALAATTTVWEANRLPRGVRIRFLASGVEFVDDNEEERVKVGLPTRCCVGLPPRVQCRLPSLHASCRARVLNPFHLLGHCRSNCAPP